MRPAREEAIGKKRKLHYGEFSDLYYPPSIIWVIISRRKVKLRTGI
jgi:hypothetical protein